MIRSRPAHLTKRPMVGAAFGQPVTHITTTSTRNRYGEPVTTESPETIITAATAPGQRGNALVRELSEAGIRIEGIRMFWTPVEITTAGEGDILIHQGIRWRARLVDPWGDMWEVAAVREEPQ